jgi:DNA-binding NarL/FixJ family response regulator
MSKIRILIADDQVLMRDGLKTILNLEEDMEVVGIAQNGLEAFETAKSLNPDVVLMDIRMPVMDGVESVKLIKKSIPKTVVIMLTTFDDDEYIIEALSFGANGYLLKNIPADKLIDAIRDGVRGNLLMPATIAAKLAARLSQNSFEKKVDNKLINELSERELEIAKLLVKGLTNRQISSQLYISEGTVKNYISSIYSKIEISDRTQALIYLKNLGL